MYCAVLFLENKYLAGSSNIHKFNRSGMFSFLVFYSCTVYVLRLSHVC